MPSVRVTLPAALTTPDPALLLDCDADSVGAALRAAAAQTPRYAQRLFFNDRLVVSVILNGRHLAPTAALATTLSAGDHLEVIPPVAGG